MTEQEDRELTTLLGCLDVLDERRRLVIVQRFGLDGGGCRTLKKVGVSLGVNPSRVRVLQYTAMYALKREAKKRGFIE